ncbi:hypothetical protein BGZ54_000762 [Gamsiella multidivaricata]|nr:hypothetical protein BGZ54_000762 [Gamsiella multidivaricata]
MATVASSGSTGSLPAAGFVQRQRTIHGTSMDLKRASITRTTTPTLKRRQTITVASPMAEEKVEKLEDTNGYQQPITSSSFTNSGFEAPPMSVSNGFRTPISYPSPLPSRLRDMATAMADIDDDDREDDEDSHLPEYLFSPIPTRRSLFKRVAHLNQDFGSRQHQPHTLQASRSRDSEAKKRRNQNGTGTQHGELPLSTSPESLPLDEDDDSSQDELPQDLHWEAIERILFIYAKLNPGVGYVQGMNEILGPLYYLLANDPDEVSRAHAEAESFWLFHLLMAHFRDHFVRSLDRDRTSGIGSTIARMNFRLRQFDEHLWQTLEGKGIAPEYYSFRWLTVLCTQEFEVPDVWRIWDSVLADTGGMERDYDFLLDFGCAMVCHLRAELLQGDFADNIKLLQNYPPVDIQPILCLAAVIRDQRIKSIRRQSKMNSDIRDNASRRISVDLRIWSSRRSVSDNDILSFSENAALHSLKALTIDGVKNSDRLDHNLEGIDHRSPLYAPLSAPITKDGPPIVLGLSMDGLMSRKYGNGLVSSSAATDGRRSSSLGADNFTIDQGARPQTGTWAETFTLFKARFVVFGGSSSPPKTLEESEGRTKQVDIADESVEALPPSVEL